MHNDTDLLKIKIEQAKHSLPKETLDAISVVDWKQAILEMRNNYGFSFEQLGDLEIVTELVFCGLLNPKDYPREIESRMGVSKTQALELVNEMNESVFKKIRAELIKNTERQRIFTKKIEEEKKQKETDSKILHEAGIKIVDRDMEIKADLSVPEIEAPHPILTQKLTQTVQLNTIKTDHTIEKITPPSQNNEPAPIRKVDPYREIPE